MRGKIGKQDFLPRSLESLFQSRSLLETSRRLLMIDSLHCIIKQLATPLFHLGISDQALERNHGVIIAAVASVSREQRMADESISNRVRARHVIRVRSLAKFCEVSGKPSKAHLLTHSTFQPQRRNGVRKTASSRRPCHYPTLIGPHELSKATSQAFSNAACHLMDLSYVVAHTQRL